MNLKLVGVMLMASSVLAGCTSVSQMTDDKTGIRVTTIAHRGCGNPSQSMTFIERKGKKEESYASTGPDVCNTLIGAGAQIAASAVLPKGAGINNTVVSGSQSSSNQSSNVQVN